jgi:hypothetical protein
MPLLSARGRCGETPLSLKVVPLVRATISAEMRHHQVIIVFDRDGWHPNTTDSLLGSPTLRCRN